MSHPPVYLDYHATTPVDRRVVEAMLPFFTETFGNPASSSHAWGWKAQEVVEAARREVANVIGASAREIVFTSGATESNNFALYGVARRAPDSRRHVVVSAIEHKAILESAARLATEGWRVSHAPVHADGRIDLDVLRDLVTPETAESLPGAMQSLGRRYVRHINAAYRRTGTLWEGRYRATPIDAEDYFLACCRYIELNPVRACMVAYPRDYPWSSWRAHAQGVADPLAADHPLYRGLGATAAERQAAYRALFRAALGEEFVEALRAATNGGWALGGERFKRKVAKVSGRRAEPLSAGRPRKPREDAKQGKLL